MTQEERAENGEEGDKKSRDSSRKKRAAEGN